MAASIRMQGPGAFVFSFFDYKLLLMPIIIMYVNLFSFSTNKVWSFGVAAYSTAPRERVWRATIKVPGFKFKVHKNEFVSARFSKTCQHSHFGLQQGELEMRIVERPDASICVCPGWEFFAPQS